MSARHIAGRAWRYMSNLSREFNEDDGPMVSAAMSFYALLSLVPLLIIAVAVLAYILHSPEAAYQRVFEYVDQYSPALAQEQGPGIRGLLEEVVRGRGVAGGLSLLVLLWSGSQFFASLERAVNIAWAVRNRRGFIQQRLIAIGMVIVVGVLLLISLGLTALMRIVQGLNLPWLGGDLSEQRWLWTVGGFLLPLFITIVMFTIVYKFLPNKPVRLWDALTGAIVTGILWEAAKQLFSWYVPRFANYSAIYGSLGSVVILMVWIYYSSIVTVIGAEVAAIKAHARTDIEPA